MKTHKKIVCFHLLNDYSGSPLVLSNVIKGFINKGFIVDLFVSKSQESGFLSDLEGVNYIYYPYKYGKYKLFTFFKLLLSQIHLFFSLFRYWNKSTVFYINTILPFGALIAGSIMRKKVICHLHETSIRPKILKKILLGIVRKSVDDLIYVSHFLKQKEPLATVNNHVVHNALSDQFIQESINLYPKFKERFKVLMISSLKSYKGIFEFLSLSQKTPKIDFTLVVNASQKEIDTEFLNRNIPFNLKLYPAQKNVHPFYREANLVLNLSHPDKWIETFGMTALEAMSYGIPVIVPTIGGIAELVEDGYNGFKISVYNMQLIRRIIKDLSRNRGLYHSLSKNAKSRSEQFHIKRMNNQIQQIVLS